jgi:hypothetical protein
MFLASRTGPLKEGLHGCGDHNILHKTPTYILFQAYLTGRICANGDVKKLMVFDKLAKKGGHKPGTMFTV